MTMLQKPKPRIQRKKRQPTPEKLRQCGLCKNLYVGKANSKYCSHKCRKEAIRQQAYDRRQPNYRKPMPITLQRRLGLLTEIEDIMTIRDRICTARGGERGYEQLIKLDGNNRQPIVDTARKIIIVELNENIRDNDNIMTWTEAKGYIKKALKHIDGWILIRG